MLLITIKRIDFSHPLLTSIALLCLLSCRQKKQESFSSFVPKVVPAKGYIVPKDRMAIPRSVPAGRPKIVQAGKPMIVPARTNIHLAGIPKTIIAGTPTICTPGEDSFLLPKIVPVIIKPFLAGIPETVIAKEASSKDQNPQSFTSFSKLQGLKGNTVSCLVQDKKGNIWMGLWNGGGVSRYDGKTFTHFTENEGLINNDVWSMIEDRSGNLWIGGSSGVSKYDGKNFTNYTTKEGLVNNAVWKITQDKKGRIWIGTYGGVSKYDGKNFTNFTTEQGLPGNVVTTIYEDISGDLWLGTMGSGVSKYDGSTFTNYTTKEGLANDDVGSILEDRFGKLWFGTDRGVSKFDGKTFTNYTTKEGLIDNSITSMYKDKSGNLWFGHQNKGISKFDGIYFTHFTEEDGLANNTILSILEDRSGILWFGTDDGLSKHNGKIFTHFTRIEGLVGGNVNNIFEDRSGNLWFAGMGVSKYDGKTFTYYTEKEGLGKGGVISTMVDKAGNLWFGMYKDGGAIRYDGRNFIHFTEKEGLSNTEVHCLFQDRSGNLWFGTQEGAIKYDGNIFTHYTTREGLSSNLIWNILEDKAGSIWFGTYGGGVTKYNGTTFTQFLEKEGLSGNTVLGITEDNGGNLWIGTDGGVSRYDGKTFTQFTEKQGLSNNSVQSVIKDRTGNLWFGTAFGLNKVPVESLSRLSDDGSIPREQDSVTDRLNNEGGRRILFRSYSYEDGFLGIGCNENSICEDKNGIIWIGANGMLAAYHPEGDKADTIPPNLQITGVDLFNENIPWTILEQKKDTSIVLGNGVSVRNFKFDGISKWYYIPEQLSLAYNNNFLTFNFIGITTRSPHQVKYQYKLEGLDETWSALTTRNEAAFGNLPAGDYTFMIRAVNGDGYWSSEFSYNFIIRPPWWKTWWAYTLYIVAIAAAVSSIIAYRSRKLRLENKILEEKVGQRTIQLEQKSTELEKSLDNLKSTQAQLIHSEKMASLGELTAGIAHEIQNPLNFVNNFSEVNEELLAEMKDEMIKGNTNDALIIANDAIENQKKINLHGKRADAIVKGMLQHSRSSAGQKEPTDINALADEYLRLSYHGLRAKDKDFNATMKTNFDETIGNINIIPQDIGRVLLNLINNAFYAVNEKRATSSMYEPLVSVSTKKEGARVIITVKDNGNGIPKKIVDKIFQPFFTTKPTGSGTGLGLSLSYDIVKAHGGEIKVESREGEGSEFLIVLPSAL